MRAFPSTRYANMTATLGPLLSLGGTATAASVTLVTGWQVKVGSLTLRDLAPSSIQALTLQSGSGGAAARSLRLAGYANPLTADLSDDTTFHTIRSMHFQSEQPRTPWITSCAATAPATPSTSRSSRWR